MKSNHSVGTFAEALQDRLDSFKGLLILVVVMDHNDLLRTLAPDLFRPLTFHVLGFLILPFQLPGKPISVKFLVDRLIRYLVPFWWVLALATILYSIVYRSGEALSVVAMDWIAAATIGSATLLKTASGFYYLWFMPCLAGLVVVLAVFNSLGRPWQHSVTALAILIHTFITLFPESVANHLPFGLLIVMWVFPLGLVMRWAVNNGAVFRGRYLILAIFIASYGYLVWTRFTVEIMTMTFRPVWEPLPFFSQDLNALCGVLTAMWLAVKLGRFNFLNLCGKHSLMVYLLHPPIFFVGYKLSGAANWNLAPYQLLAIGVLSVVLTILIAIAWAVVVGRMPIARTWLTPKDWNDWGPVRWIAQRAAHP